MMVVQKQTPRAMLYKRYRPENILIYNAATILHFILGGAGIILGYNQWHTAAVVGGIIYLVFAFGQMYVLMPLVVCPNCVYTRLRDGLCISGLNLISRKLVRARKGDDLAKRAQGALSPNNLYLASLLLPLLALIPAMIIHFSWGLPVIFVILLGLLAFRFLIIFPKLACIHCQAKYKCPQAAMLGVRDR
jgi:hypothetical protein